MNFAHSQIHVYLRQFPIGSGAGQRGHGPKNCEAKVCFLSIERMAHSCGFHLLWLGKILGQEEAQLCQGIKRRENPVIFLWLFLPGKSTLWLWPEVLSRLAWYRPHWEENFLASKFSLVLLSPCYICSWAFSSKWNLWVHFLFLRTQEARQRTLRVTAPQPSKLKSGGFASPCGLHLLNFIDIQLQIITGGINMGPHISPFGLLLVFALLCFSVGKLFMATRSQCNTL